MIVSRLDNESGHKNCYSWIENHTERDDEAVYAQVYMGVVYGNEVSMEGDSRSQLRPLFERHMGKCLGNLNCGLATRNYDRGLDVGS